MKISPEPLFNRTLSLGDVNRGLALRATTTDIRMPPLNAAFAGFVARLRTTKNPSSPQKKHPL